jgi:hypothetical protein
MKRATLFSMGAALAEAFHGARMSFDQKVGLAADRN